MQTEKDDFLAAWPAYGYRDALAAHGGFDAYLAEARSGRGIARPSWSHKISVYLRGEGVIEQRGYFLVAKAERPSSLTVTDRVG